MRNRGGGGGGGRGGGVQGGNEVLVGAARGEHVVARTLREGRDSDWQSRPRMRTLASQEINAHARACIRRLLLFRKLVIVFIDPGQSPGKAKVRALLLRHHEPKGDGKWNGRA